MTFGLGWLWSIFSSFWFWLDRSIYDLIGNLYNILIDISRVSILSQGTIQSVAGRIKILLGVFMLFKVSFSLIMYIVNPDDFTDKSKGVSKLAMNTIISLVMLAIVPYIFNMAFRLQAMILDDNTLARIIFGDGTDDEGKGYQRDILSGGDKIKYEILMPFFQPNYYINGLESCATLKDEDGKLNNKCYKQLLKKINDTDKTNIENYKLGIGEESFGLTFRLNTINTTLKGDSETYLFDYKWPLTTISGVIVSLLLISFCIDIGVRSIKLAFLQLIAPIPIISYMDPKSGKDGLFGKWAKMCGTTYISLFVRLLVLFLGIFIITNIDELVDVVDGSTETDPVVKIFIIIGVLFFIKQLPQILNNLGIKLDGDGKFTLNPFKKMEEGMIGGKIASKLPAAAAGAAVGLGIGAVGTATGAGAGKWFTGMASGLSGGLKGKKIGEIHKDQVAANARLREARANGSTFMGRMGARATGFIGAESAGSRMEREQKALEKQKQFYDQQAKAEGDIRERIMDELTNNGEYDTKTTGKEAWFTARQKLLKAQAEYESAKQSGDSIKIANAKAALNQTEDKAYKYILESGQATVDGKVKSIVREFNVRNQNNQEYANEAGLSDLNFTKNTVGDVTDDSNFDSFNANAKDADGIKIHQNFESLSNAKKQSLATGNNVSDTLYAAQTSDAAQVAAANQAGIGKS